MGCTLFGRTDFEHAVFRDQFSITQFYDEKRAVHYFHYIIGRTKLQTTKRCMYL